MTPQDLAIQTARSSRHHRFMLGAVLVGRVGLLDAKSNLPAMNTRGVCAEERILRHPPRGGTGGELYVARVLKCDGSITMAKPCEKCMRIIRARGIKTVHYTDWSGEWQKISL